MKNNLTGLLFTAISISLFFLSSNQKINAQTTIESFNPNANGMISSIVVQANGKVLIGGDFTTIGGQEKKYLARLNPDGTLDTDFNSGANSAVSAIAIQIRQNSREQDIDMILVASEFTTAEGETKILVTRLGPDGTPDPKFNPQEVVGGVNSLVVQPNDDILVGGNFDSLGGQPRSNIARLGPNGRLDTEFNPSANSAVYSFAIQAADQGNDKIFVAGTFDTIAGQPRTGLALLNYDGSLDTSFNSPLAVNSAVLSTAIQPDGKLVFGGLFGSVGGQPIKNLAQLNVNGSVDTTFKPNPDQDVHAMAIQPDGEIIVGGYFTNIGGQPRTHLARLNADGTLDTTFEQNVGKNELSAVWSIATQKDGGIVVGGTFASLGGQPRNNIVRLKTKLDDFIPFIPAVVSGGSVSTMISQANGGILIGGSFTTVGGQPRKYLTRLLSNGTLAPEFNPEVFTSTLSGSPLRQGQITVSSIVQQPDGKILIGGNFFEVGEERRVGVARLNPDGGLDTTFMDPNVKGTVSVIAIQADGGILIGGNFDSIQGQPRKNLARLTSAGKLDENFKQDADGTVFSIVIHGDGTVVGGVFKTIGGQPRNRIARLKSDGTLDSSFIPNFITGADKMSVNKIAIQPDNKVLFIGSFSYGAVRYFVARLNGNGSLDQTFFDRVSPRGNSLDSIQIQKDGRILVGGRFDEIGKIPIFLKGEFVKTDPQPSYNIARLQTDGILDTTFNPNIFNPNIDDSVGAIAIQADNKILVGARTVITRLDPGISTPYNPDRSNNRIANFYYKFYGLAEWWYSGISLPKTIATGLSNGRAITIEYWFRGKNLQSAVRLQNGQDYIVAGLGETEIPPHVLSNEGGTGGRRVFIRTFKDNRAGIIEYGSVYDDSWHHIAMTWEQNKDRGFKSYVDGNLVDESSSADVPLPNLNDVTPTVGVFLQNGTLTERAFGEIGRIRIWKVARTAAQIKESKDRATEYPADANLLYQTP